ncbi:MAG: ABC transporter permease [Planctomycetota bacterium]
MSRARLIGSVGWWEFRRCWRIKDVVITAVVAVGLALLWLGVLKLLAVRASDAPARIVVLESSPLSVALQLPPNVERVSDEGRDEETLRAAVDEGVIDGLMRIEDEGRGWVYVTESPWWLESLRGALDEACRAARLRDAGLAPDTFERLSAGFELDVRESSLQPAASTLAEKIAAGIFVRLMLMALLVGSSYLFLYITGEKQQRVTEQIVSIISPQTWIDGKIAGLSVVALASMASMVIGMIIWNSTLAVLGHGYDLTFGVIRPLLLVQLAVLAALGFLLWFAFFGAIAATIDDPNTSSRSMLMFIPVIVLGVVVGCFKDPDSALMKFCGVFPLTSPSVLPARLVLTEVAWWEIALAMALLVAAIWIMRRGAGKIFAMGIMMHGKEPRWRDMVRAMWSA